MLIPLIVALAAATAPSPTAAPYFWAEPRDGDKLVVDVTSEAGLPTDKLYEALARKYKKAGAGAFDILPADDPAPFMGRKELAAAGVDGSTSLKVERIALDAGPSAFHLQVFTAKTSKSPALVAYAAPLAKGAKLRDVNIPGPKPAANVALTAYEAMLQRLGKAARATVAGTKTFGPASLHFAAGSFGRVGRWLVWIDDAIGGDLDMTHVVYAALVAADGGLVDTLVAPNITATWWHPLYLIDADGDGQDELIAQPCYYEGESVVFVRWREGKREDFTMTGDGT